MAGISRMDSRLNRRRLIAASSGAVLGASVLAKASMAAAQDGSEFTVTMVTDTAGIGDQNFNDLAKIGGDRAAAELGVQFEIQESQHRQTTYQISPPVLRRGSSRSLSVPCWAMQ
jgi:basic membrane lipoprotein Med (substrate-binding protein (PBP1-ABC) superfamily)